MKTTRRHALNTAGFTLVELMLTMVIVSILMVTLVEVISNTEKVWWREQSKVSEYEEGRTALEAMSRRLAEANLDSCWAYGKDSSGKDNYTRASDGHFVSGRADDLLANGSLTGHAVFFQSPFGHTGDGATAKAPNAHLERMDSLLNCLGYYVAYGSDMDVRPAFLTSSGQQMMNPERKRFRLMEFRQPSEEMTLYSKVIALNNASTTRDRAYAWFRGPFAKGKTVTDYSTVLAENVLALILTPQWLDTNISKNITTSKSVDDYYYDTREVQWGGNSAKAVATQHQLPPTIKVTLIVTEEKAYQTLENALGVEEAATSVRDIFNGRFTALAKQETDILEVEQGLTALKLNHRIFSTTIALRGSKWIIEKTL